MPSKKDAKKEEAEKGYEPKPNEKLVTFVPLDSFTGWPFGYSAENRKGIEFEAKRESIPVPESYKELLITKGLVADKKPTAAAVDAQV